MPSGIPKNGVNRGWFKRGEHPSSRTEFKKGLVPWIKGKHPISPFKKEKIIKKCLICGKEFKVSQSRKNIAKYCSKECLGKANRNYRRTKKTKKKISKALKGIKRSEKTKENMKKASLKRWQDPKYRMQFSGKNHFNWQGGKSFEPYGLEFNEDLKEVIRNRERRKCFVCEKTELENKEKLTVHHTDYNKLNNNPNNLVALCRGCHTKTNYNRKKWIEYFQQKLWQH